MFGAPIAHEDDSERAVRAGARDPARAGRLRRASVRRGLRRRAARAHRRQHRPGGRHRRRRRRRPALQRARRHRQRRRPAAGAGGRGRGHARPADGRPGARLLRARAARRDRRCVAASAPIDRVPRDRRARATRAADRPSRWSAATASWPTSASGLERLAEGIGMIVSVTGEPGIGKSRLVADAVEPLRDRAAAARGPRAVLHRELPLLAGARAAARLARRSAPPAAEARVRLELKAALARRVRRRPPSAYPFLAALLGLHA